MNMMPVGRDVRVAKAEADESPSAASESGAGDSEKPNLSELVTVMGFDRKDVLFRSNNVGVVQWRDRSGEIVALLIRMKPDIWGFSRRGDEDWLQNLEMFGNQDT